MLLSLWFIEEKRRRIRTFGKGGKRVQSERDMRKCVFMERCVNVEMQRSVELDDVLCLGRENKAGVKEKLRERERKRDRKRKRGREKRERREVEEGGNGFFPRFARLVGFSCTLCCVSMPALSMSWPWLVGWGGWLNAPLYHAQFISDIVVILLIV